jgi:hypothetical protein
MNVDISYFVVFDANVVFHGCLSSKPVLTGFEEKNISQLRKVTIFMAGIAWKFTIDFTIFSVSGKLL